MAKPKLQAGDYWSAERILREEKRARHLREEDVGLGYLCYAYALPGSNPYRYGTDVDPTTRRMKGTRGAVAQEVARIYHPQLQESLKRFVDTTFADLFPDGNEWANLEPGDDVDEKTAIEPDEAADRADAHEDMVAKLEPMQRRAFQDLHRSKFSLNAPAAVRDAAIWRVGVLRIRRTATGEGPSSVTVHHVSQAECSFIWGPNGECWGVFRRHSFNREECEAEWPQGTGWTFPKEEDGDGRSTFTEACYRVPGKTPWAYQVVQEEHAKVCVQRESKRNPYIVFGLTGEPGSSLTVSLVEMALPAARTLNALTRITIEGSEFRAVPTYKARQGSLMNFAQNRLTPGGIITVTDMDALAALDVPADVQIGWMTAQELVDFIKQIMYDTSLPDQNQPKTAYEIRELVRKYKNEKGSMYNRLMGGLGVPVLQHVLDALYELKEVEGMNHEGDVTEAVELDGREVKVSFQNPLSQAQRQQDTENATVLLETLQARVPPEIYAALVDFDWYARYVQTGQSIPEGILKPKGAEQMNLRQQAEQTLVTGGGATSGPMSPTPDGSGASTMGAQRPLR